MSRTFRRQQAAYFALDTFEEFDLYNGVGIERSSGLTVEQAYVRMRASYRRDHRSGRYGVPRWYRRLHGAKHTRLIESHSIFRCLQRDEWELHAPDSRFRDTKFYNW